MALTDPDAIRRHLLAHLVPNLLSDRGTSAAEDPFRPSRHWPADRAQRWLATLAEHLTMAATTELAWWALDELGPSRPRRVLGAVLAIAAGALVGGTVFAVHGPENLPVAVAFTVLFALAFGIALGMVLGLFRWADVPTALDSARTPAKVLGADRQLTVVAACTLGAMLSLLSCHVLPPAMSATAQLTIGLATFPLWTLLMASRRSPRAT